MNNKLIIGLMFGLMLISMVSAYDSHKQNIDYNLVVNSNNATACNVTYIKFPNGSSDILNQAMTRDATTFYTTIGGGNFSTLGDTCLGVSCTDGSTNEVGSKCLEITPSGNGGVSNIVFFVFLIVFIYGINFFGFFGKNEIMTILGGMALMFLGLYMVNQGVIIYRDNLTNYFAYLTIAWGFISSMWAVFELIQDL